MGSRISGYGLGIGVFIHVAVEYASCLQLGVSWFCLWYTLKFLTKCMLFV